MIEIENFLAEFGRGALWCPSDCEPTDLARYASDAISHNANALSVAPSSVAIVWPWLENTNISIYARFYLNETGVGAFSDIVESINSAFKQGASGAQIFIRSRDIDTFVGQLYAIRDDLFFNKSLIIGFDISDIGPYEWTGIWAALEKYAQQALCWCMPVIQAINPILLVGYMRHWMQ